MNKISKLLNSQIKMGYWNGFSTAMYPSQFAYDKVNVNFDEIWKDTKEVNLYFHIPFCKFICSYCGFFSVVEEDNEYIKKYINKLNEQLKFYKDKLHNDVKIKSICFGGGTPNRIPVEFYYSIFDNIKKLGFQIDKDIEPSMEVSPELLNEEYIKNLSQVGIKRLSLGIQSLDFDIRKSANRKENYSYHNIIDMIRKYNLNINIDLINGMEFQTEESFMKTLEQVVLLKPETISIYPLAGNNSSMFKTNPNIMSNKQKYELFKRYYEFLLSNGYYCESNIKFVLKNQPSTHQQKIYEYQGVDTLGIGCAARSYNRFLHYGLEKRFNIADRKNFLNEYINTKFEDMDWYGVHIDEDERKSRFIIYGFLIDKLDLSRYQELFNSIFLDEFKDEIEALFYLELAKKNKNIINLTEKGRVYTDIICMQFWSEKIKKLYKNTL